MIFFLVPIFAFSSATFTGSEAAQSVAGEVNIINNISSTSVITIHVSAAPSGSALNSKLLHVVAVSVVVATVIIVVALVIVVLSLATLYRAAGYRGW